MPASIDCGRIGLKPGENVFNDRAADLREVVDLEVYCCQCARKSWLEGLAGHSIDGLVASCPTCGAEVRFEVC